MKTYLAVVFLFPLYFVSCYSWASEEADEPTTQDSFGFNGDVTARIVGGEDADQPYPWMVSIQKGRHFCAGALIGKNWVVTAAHCLDDVDASQLTLMIGPQNLSSLSGAEVRKASWIQIHHDFQSSQFYSDIAIIKLDRSSSKTPIKIIDQAARNGLAQNEKMRVIGWGLTEEGVSASFSYGLQQVDVSYQDDKVCDSKYGSYGVSDYWNKSFCAGEILGEKDACQGDSGGPIMVKAEGEWALAGLVSWGVGCAREGHYGAYTEVAAFESWIEQRREGVTILGPDTMGYLGLDLSTSQAYTVMNLGKNNAVVDDKFIEQSALNVFSIDESSWLLGNEIPAVHECSFVVNAQGGNAGEFNGDLQLNVGGEIIHQALNTSVLNTIDGNSLDVDWTFYSGTSDLSEQTQGWAKTGADISADSVDDSSLKTEGRHNERSVLLAYINGSGSETSHYLKFDTKITSTASDDALYLYVNEEIINLENLSVASASASANDSDSGQWRSYGVELPANINHVRYEYVQNSGADAAYLDNFRVCLDPEVEATCSNASNYSNTDSLEMTANSVSEDSWQSVCTEVDYQDNPIEYASRSSGDAEFGVWPKKSSRSLGLGSVDHLLALLLAFLFVRKPLGMS